MSRHRKQHKHHEEHIDETWLIPYADLLTLLLALFIVLFASSQIDAKKLGDMGQVFNAIFNSNVGILNQPQALPTTVSSNTPVASNHETSDALKTNSETIQLLKLKEEIDKYIIQNNLSGELSSTLTDEGLMITIGEFALFPSGSAQLLPGARKIVNEISVLLTAHPQKVTIAGHTDDVPINTVEFPSNWDLSSKRALNFMKLLLTNKQLHPEQFNATGYGEFHPVAPNNTPEGRQKNRRVEVLIRRNHKVQ